MLHGSGLPIPFLITPAWRTLLVACDSEASCEASDPRDGRRHAQELGCQHCLTHAWTCIVGPAMRMAGPTVFRSSCRSDSPVPSQSPRPSAATDRCRGPACTPCRRESRTPSPPTRMETSRGDAAADDGPAGRARDQRIRVVRQPCTPTSRPSRLRGLPSSRRWCRA